MRREMSKGIGPIEHRADDEDGMEGEKAERRVGGAALGASTVGVTAGAIGGALLGPVGLAIGAIAGVVGGWWAGKGIATSLQDVDGEDTHFRSHYETSPNRLADRSYEDVRPAYHLGGIASRNPAYEGRSFDDIEADLRHGWTSELEARHGAWASVRDFARAGYMRDLRSASNVRARELDASASSDDVSGTDSLHKASFSDRLADPPERVEEGLPRVRE
jgi:hypothetical protein